MIVNGHVKIIVGNMSSKMEGDVPGTLLEDALSYQDTNMARSLKPNWHPWKLDDTTGTKRDRVIAEKHERAKVRLFDVMTGTFPTGLLGKAVLLLKSADYTYEIIDRSVPPSKTLPGSVKLVDRYMGEPLVLRDYQQDCVDVAMKNRSGMFALATNAGKSLIACGIIAKLGVKTLILVQQTESLVQWRDEFIPDYLGVKPGYMMGGSRPVIRPITVGLIQTARKFADVLKRYGIGIVIVDELHHSASQSYYSFLNALNPYYLYGLSGTAFRTRQAENLLLESLFGKRLAFITNEHLWKMGYSKPVDLDVKVVRHSVDKELSWLRTYGLRIVRGPRNKRVVDSIRKYYKLGHSILVLVNEIEHCEELDALLKKTGIVYRIGHGQIPAEKRKKYLREFKSGEVKVLIGTLYRESIDVSKISVVINAAAQRSSVRMFQSLGRGTRKGDHDRCIYVDFWDSGSYYLEQHSAGRMGALEDAGCVLPTWVKNKLDTTIEMRKQMSIIDGYDESEDLEILDRRSKVKLKEDEDE